MNKIKKLISICLIVAFVFGTLHVAVYADDEIDATSYGHAITVTLPNDLPQEIQDRIYAHFYGLSVPGDNPDNVLCTLFGHKLTETTASVITHNVYSNAPRCVEKIYDVSVCSRCDYVSQELLSSTRIFCH